MSRLNPFSNLFVRYLRQSRSLPSLMFGFCFAAALFSAPAESIAQTSVISVTNYAGDGQDCQKGIRVQTVQGFVNCWTASPLSSQLAPLSNELDGAKGLIASQDATIKELAAKNEVLEKNLKSLSDAVDALTARLNRGESK